MKYKSGMPINCNSIVITVSFLFLLTFFSTHLHAHYLGVYTSGAAGQITLKHPKTSSQQVYDNYLAGGGVLFETEINRVYIYNYRLNCGFDRVFIRNATRKGSDYSGVFRGNITNRISYNIFEKRRFKLWIGPQIGLHLISGKIYSTEDKFNRDLIIALFPFVFSPLSIYYIADYLYKDKNFMDLAASFAPVFGMNFYPDRNFAVSIESGLRVGVHFPVKNSFKSGSMYRYEGFFNISFLIHITKE